MTPDDLIDRPPPPCRWCGGHTSYFYAFRENRRGCRDLDCRTCWSPHCGKTSVDKIDFQPRSPQQLKLC